MPMDEKNSIRNSEVASIANVHVYCVFTN
uniref:Uncharacterized protein n=1 Tax=Heterorhabditis bacteriophora TaxID=37862 RepID=A0A1I7WKR6_HETBA